MERGRIANRKRAKQLRDFSGLRIGKITPTDIDMSEDFEGQVFIFAETKLKNTDLKWGQRKHLEYLIQALRYPAVAYITEHEIYDPEIDIDMANTIVIEKFTNTLLGGKRKIYKWQVPEEELLLCDEVRKFTRCHYRNPPPIVKNDLIPQPEIFNKDEDWINEDWHEIGFWNEEF